MRCPPVVMLARRIGTKKGGAQSEPRRLKRSLNAHSRVDRVSKHSELDIDRQNAERSRRGRTARARGNAFEREVAKRLGAARVGQFGGKQDVANEWIAVQCKVGKSYPERLDGWLRSVPVKGDQLAALVVGDSPGAGARRRTMIVLDLDDFIAWFGKEDNAKEES